MATKPMPSVTHIKEVAASYILLPRWRNGIFSFGELGSLWYGNKTDAVSRSDQRSSGKLHPADSMVENGIFSFGELGGLCYGGIQATHRAHFQ